MREAPVGVSRCGVAVEILLAHRLPMLLAGMQAWLEAVSSFKIIAAVSNGNTALAVAQALRPAIALVDASLPGVDGVAFARHLQGIGLPIPVILLNASAQQAAVRAALEAGIRGMILPHAAVDHLALAIRAVHGGGLYIDPEIAGSFWAQAGSEGRDPRTMLTMREADVLRAVAFGFSIKEIAGQLGITTKSVETYKIRACDKIGLGSRAQIVRFALLQGWFEAPSLDRPGIAVTMPPGPVWLPHP